MEANERAIKLHPTSSLIFFVYSRTLNTQLNPYLFSFSFSFCCCFFLFFYMLIPFYHCYYYCCCLSSIQLPYIYIKINLALPETTAAQCEIPIPMHFIIDRYKNFLNFFAKHIFDLLNDSILTRTTGVNLQNTFASQPLLS